MRVRSAPPLLASRRVALCELTSLKPTDPSKIQVTEAEGQALADQYGIKFFLTSAKNNVRVSDAFESVARDVKNRLLKDGVGKPAAGATKATTAAVDPSKPAAAGGQGGCCGGSS